MQFEGEYFGGNFNLKTDAGLQKTNVLLKIEDKLSVYLAIAPLSHQYRAQSALSIAYGDIVRIENMPSERIGALRLMVMPTPMAAALRKKEYYLNVTFRDLIGMEQNIVFKVKQADECYKAVYDKVAESRGKIVS